MTESITSSGELRQFASENSGRRKIDVQQSLDLHQRAANQIDLLGEHLPEMQRKLNAAGREQSPAVASEPVAKPSLAAGEDPSQAALIVLQRAQETAEVAIAEAEEISAQAQRVRDEADAIAELRAETMAEAAMAEARGQAAHIIDAAQQRASEVAEATALAADRSAFAQRQYRNKTSSLRIDAESLVEIAQRMESVAGEDLPATLTARPFTDATLAPAEPPTTPPVPAPAPAALADSSALDPEDEIEEEIVLEDDAAAKLAAAPDVLPPPPVVEAATVLPPPRAAAVVEEVAAPAATLPPPPDASLLPPPPAVSNGAPAAVGRTEFLPPPSKDVLDLTETELEEVLGGKSIDDELFDDDLVIDLTDDEKEPASQGFEFFSRD